MNVFAISDLHLPADGNKPMDIFGAHWERHFERISEDWRSKVTDEDTVLLPGDLSWAMHLSGALNDIARVGELPGKKILIRGNHDYWWSSISRVREALPAGMYALQNDALRLDGFTYCGTRGWILPGEGVQDDDVRIYKRELGRLELSLDYAQRVQGDTDIICLLHYPPLTDAQRDTEMTALLKSRNVRHTVYGHLHGSALMGAFRGEHDSVFYHQVSCDGIDFKLELIASK